MGLSFQTAEESNPINHTPAVQQDPCAELRAELDLVNQFLEDNGYAHLFDHYKYILANPELATGAEVISDDEIDFEEVK
jgi:hypothetical protein